MKISLNIPPFWTMISMIAIWQLSSFLPNPDLSGFYPKWIPIIILSVGVTYIIWAARYFLKFSTTIHPNKRPDILMTSGPFRISRNPIYTGMAMIVLATALYFGALIGFVVFAAFIFWIQYRYIRVEEMLILEKFKEEAEAYFANTRRW